MAVVLLCCHVPGIFAQNCDEGSTPVAQVLDLSTLTSIDGLDDPDNDVATVCGFAVRGNIVGSTHAGIDIQTVNGSWCSEVRIKTGTYTLSPALGENSSGPCSNGYSGGDPALFQQQGIVFTADEAGCVEVEVYENLDDNVNSIDADITSGTMTIYGCPENSYLPIELRNFSGEISGSKNILRWTTESEVNSAWHIVERSANGLTDWKEIGRLKGEGTSNEPINYELTDESPLSFSYYRLLELSFTGGEQFSHVIAVERPSDGFSISGVSPNPANDFLTIDFENVKPDELNLEIFDAFGKRVRSQQVYAEEGFQRLKVSVPGLPTGTYFLVLGNGREQLSKMFVKK